MVRHIMSTNTTVNDTQTIYQQNTKKNIHATQLALPSLTTDYRYSLTDH